jgi:hypothetical protein
MADEHADGLTRESRQLRRDGELFAAHGAFAMKQDAIRWAEEQRDDLERGSTDQSF